MSLSSGAYFGNHSTVSQCARSASAAHIALLVWIGPLSSVRTVGLIGTRAVCDVALQLPRPVPGGAVARLAKADRLIAVAIEPSCYPS